MKRNLIPHPLKKEQLEAEILRRIEETLNTQFSNSEKLDSLVFICENYKILRDLTEQDPYDE